MVGFNLAALTFVKQHLEDKEQVMFFADATTRFRDKKRKAKKRALLTMKWWSAQNYEMPTTTRNKHKCETAMLFLYVKNAMCS